MSEVVPLPSFGEVFFDARGQERCLRVTWHEGTLVLSLWRGEMCTASFRMPLDDVDRLLGTLREGLAELQGERRQENPAAPDPAPPVPAEQRGEQASARRPEEATIPGTGQYNRPPDSFPGGRRGADDRPTAMMSPSDVLVARGTPPPQDRLVASAGEPAAGSREAYPAAAGYAEPLSGAEPGDPVYQFPGGPRPGPQAPAQPPRYHMDALGPPRADEHGRPSRQVQPDPFAQRYSGHPGEPGHSGQAGQQRQRPGHNGQPGRQAGHGGQPAAAPSTPGLGTPMHGIPGAGRRRPHQGGAAPQHSAGPAGPLQTGPMPAGMGQHGPALAGAAQQQLAGAPQGGQPVPSHTAAQGRPSPVDSLLALSTPQPDQQPLSRPYAAEDMFVTGERLRPDQRDSGNW